MARVLVDSTTESESHELVFEKLIVAMVQDAVDDVDSTDKPEGLVLVRAHETDVSKPPAIVCGLRRIEVEPPKTGIWLSEATVEFRFSLRDTGYLDRIFRSVCDKLTYANVEADLTSGEAEVVPGSVYFDLEVEREFVEKKFEVRRYGWRMNCKLADTFIRQEDELAIQEEDGDPLRTEDAA